MTNKNSLKRFEIEKYTTGLLNETISRENAQKEISNKSWADKSYYFVVLQIILGRNLKSLINSLDKNEVNTWKDKFHDIFYNVFADEMIKPLSLLNLEPFKRTLILSVKKDNNTNIEKRLTDSFKSLSSKLRKKHGSSVIGCLGSFEEEFINIGRSYKNARILQDYSFSIGTSQIAIYEKFDFKNSLNLIEYKFIESFATKLKEENWIQTGILLEKMRETFKNNLVKNSKTIYVYKELFSLTIRHLLYDEATNLREIKKLNKAISFFEDEFNDLNEVHSFYVSILEVIASKGQISSNYHMYIQKTLDIIEKNYMKELSLAGIANDFKITASYLSRLFKEETGVNFIEYLLEYRIRKAKEYLKNTKMNINEIAIKTGYRDHNQFTRSFKKREGITPSFYRQS